MLNHFDSGNTKFSHKTFEIGGQGIKVKATCQFIEVNYVSQVK